MAKKQQESQEAEDQEEGSYLKQVNCPYQTNHTQ